MDEKMATELINATHPDMAIPTHYGSIVEKPSDGDVRRLYAEGKNICVIGDYNCTFSDNYYYTKFAREFIVKTFRECGMAILTENQPECIDHIAVSDAFINGADVTVTEWNLDKALSDHKGIVVNIR